MVAFANLFIGVGVFLSLCAFRLWLTRYPDERDPKNFYYVLWKHGLNPNMNLDAAVTATYHDGDSGKALVLGLRRDQLEARFGYIRALNEVSPYLQACYFGLAGSQQPDAALVEIATKGQRAFFLRGSPWMVVMSNGRASYLIRCKGY